MDRSFDGELGGINCRQATQGRHQTSNQARKEDAKEITAVRQSGSQASQETAD